MSKYTGTQAATVTKIAAQLMKHDQSVSTANAIQGAEAIFDVATSAGVLDPTTVFNLLEHIPQLNPALDLAAAITQALALQTAVLAL